MSTSIISGDDLRYFVQQSPAQLTTIMGQMTTLIQDITDTQNDTNERVESMEKQGWFKRMWATVSGKNKATKAEIQRNQDKVVSYVSQAVAQCYQMNCIDQQAICSLGNRMNQVYSQVNEFYSELLQMKAQIAEIQLIQQQTLQALGGFVTQLNEKIESVDSFHMLITEIQQGRYSDSSKLYSLCNILAQLDKRTLDDSRKIGILKDALLQSKIIDDAEMSISEYLMHILSLPEDKIGVMYLELCNFRNSFPANLFADMIENYHFLSKMEKMSKKKETIVQKLLDKYELDESAEFSIDDILESFLENKQESFIRVDVNSIENNAFAQSEIESLSVREDKLGRRSTTQAVKNDYDYLSSFIGDVSIDSYVSAWSRPTFYDFVNSYNDIIGIIQYNIAMFVYYNAVYDILDNNEMGRNPIRHLAIAIVIASVNLDYAEIIGLDTEKLTEIYLHNNGSLLLLANYFEQGLPFCKSNFDMARKYYKEAYAHDKFYSDEWEYDRYVAHHLLGKDVEDYIRGF